MNILLLCVIKFSYVIHIIDRLDNFFIFKYYRPENCLGTCSTSVQFNEFFLCMLTYILHSQNIYFIYIFLGFLFTRVL